MIVFIYGTMESHILKFIMTVFILWYFLIIFVKFKNIELFGQNF